MKQKVFLCNSFWKTYYLIIKLQKTFMFYVLEKNTVYNVIVLFFQEFFMRERNKERVFFNTFNSTNWNAKFKSEHMYWKVYKNELKQVRNKANIPQLVANSVWWQKLESGPVIEHLNPYFSQQGE